MNDVLGSLICPAFSAAFAAVAIWLLVRVVNRRERWAVVMAIVIGVLVAAGSAVILALAYLDSIVGGGP